jgi:hypothetical protein
MAHQFRFLAQVAEGKEGPCGAPIRKKLLVRGIPRANRRRVQRFLDLVRQSVLEWRSYGGAQGSIDPGVQVRHQEKPLAPSAAGASCSGHRRGRRRRRQETEDFRYDKPRLLALRFPLAHSLRPKVKPPV